MPAWILVPLVLISLYAIAFGCLYLLAMAVADDIGTAVGHAILRDREKREGGK